MSQALGLLFEVTLVTAVVAVHLAVGDFDRALGHAIEQVAIVGDEQDGVRVLVDQVLFEPLDGLGVEVIRGLVQDRQIGAGDEHACQRHSALLAAAHARYLGFGPADPEMIQKGDHLVLAIPAAQALDIALRGVLLLEEQLQISFAASQ